MPANGWQIVADFTKRDDERRLAFGWAYVADDAGELVVDHSGDFVDQLALGDLEDAVYDYVLKSREADDMHQRFEGVAQLVESVMITAEKRDAMGLEGSRTGWWVGFKVFDDTVWQQVRTGERPAFSIRGTGERETLDDA